MVSPTPTPGHLPGQTAPKPVAAAAAGEKKEPKAPKPKKEGTGVARPRLPKFPDEHVITVLKENAKSRGANARFLRYKTGQTVKQYLDKIKDDFPGRTDGQTFADMRWDADHKFINVGPTVVPVPAPAPTPAPTPTPTKVA
jgi:hypothetical protein